MDYFVGIDFGHGETAAWYIPVNDDENISERGVALKIKTSNEPNKMKFPSRIYQFPDGTYSVNLKARRKIITEFKKKIAELNLPSNTEKKEGYKEFIKDVVNRIIHNYKDVFLTNEGEPTFCLCIACPTQWSRNEAEDYLNFFNEALSSLEYNVEVFWVINESDAAYFTHKSDDQTVLVIDYGSSTIDYTLISKGTKIDIDKYSNRSDGASCIEEAMLENMRQKEEVGYQSWVRECNDILQSPPSPDLLFDVTSELKYSLREAKEIGYTENVNDDYPDRPFDYSIDYNPGATTQRAMPSIKDQDFFDNVLKNYYLKIEKDFIRLNNVVNEKLSSRNMKLDKIVLSGGACIMPWVRKTVKKVFQIDAKKITDDPHPEYVVAQGIALYAKAQYKAVKELERLMLLNDFVEMYKRADGKATQIAIKRLLPNTLEKITGTKDLSGNQILGIVIPFFEHCDSSDPEYRSIMHEQMNAILSQKISEAVCNAIFTGFGKKLSKEERNSINVSIDIPNFFFKPGVFRQGKLFDKLVQVIASCKGRFTNWEKTRDLSRRRDIANIILSHYSQIGALDITYDNEGLLKMEEKIRDAAIGEAKKFFYDKELFKTTFKPE